VRDEPPPLRRRRGARAASALRVPRARRRGQGEVVDDAGRKVRVPARAARIFASGPPASILVFAVAPDALIGWTTPFRPPSVPTSRRSTPTFPRSDGSPGAATPRTSRS
jgi:iron complex transport system substrate-binding protein